MAKEMGAYPEVCRESLKGFGQDGARGKMETRILESLFVRGGEYMEGNIREASDVMAMFIDTGTG